VPTDSDGDGLLDGQELGVETHLFEDTDLEIFVPDTDPMTTTLPDDADSDDDDVCICTSWMPDHSVKQSA